MQILSSKGHHGCTIVQTFLVNGMYNMHHHGMEIVMKCKCYVGQTHSSHSYVSPDTFASSRPFSPIRPSRPCQCCHEIKYGSPRSCQMILGFPLLVETFVHEFFQLLSQSSHMWPTDSLLSARQLNLEFYLRNSLISFYGRNTHCLFHGCKVLYDYIGNTMHNNNMQNFEILSD